MDVTKDKKEQNKIKKDNNEGKRVFKSRSFVFTLYKIDETESEKLKLLYENGFCRTLMFTHELGNDKTNPHIQGYMTCVNSNRIANVKHKINSLFDFDPNPHIEIARGTAYENYNYVTKELKTDSSLKHVMMGDIPLPPGKKRDDSKFESYVSLLENGKITLQEIETADLAHYVRHESRYLSVRSKLLKKAIQPPTFVCWFSGTTGTGKSYTAKEIATFLGFEIYDAGCENNFFNNYNGEECSIWDDYRSGPITFATLLKITDRDGCIINIKGGKVFFRPKIQIFTSPEGVESAKTNEMKINSSLDNKFEQLKRRVHYTANFDSEDKTTIPSLEEVKRVSEFVKIRCLGAYKTFLKEEGYEQFIDLISGLKDINAIQYKRLVERNVNNKITITDNC